MAYMIINGLNTNTLTECVITDFGETKEAEARRGTSVSVYGANGRLELLDGAYDGYKRDFTFVLRKLNEAIKLIEQFKALDNEVEMGYIPGSLFFCDLKSASYKPLGITHWKVDISVDMHPFRYLKNNEVVVFTKSGSIDNPGTVYAEPVIIIEGDGEVSLTIGEQVLQLQIEEKVTIDCRHKRQNIYDKDGQLRNTARKRGPFFEIPVGQSGVAISGNVTKVTIKGNWRYRI